MAWTEEPDEDDLVWTYRIGVDVSVAARDMPEARALVERTLDAEDSDGQQFMLRSRRQLGEDRHWGVMAWELVPPRPSQAALVQAEYPGLINELAAIEALRILNTGRAGASLAATVPEDTLARIRTALAHADPDLRVEAPDSGDVVFEGRASLAANQLNEGVYRAFDYDDREYALVVAPSELSPTGRVAAAFPRQRNDARALDEISALLERHRPGEQLPELIREISRKVNTTRRAGVPSWIPLEGETTARPPAQLHIGVIVWEDPVDIDPTVLVDRHPVTLARAVATTLHENLDSQAFVGAADFLASHAGPDDWRRPEDVDAWLQELQRATSLPSVTFHQVPVPTGFPTVETGPTSAIAQVLDARAQQLAGPIDRGDRTDPDSAAAGRSV